MKPKSIRRFKAKKRKKKLTKFLSFFGIKTKEEKYPRKKKEPKIKPWFRGGARITSWRKRER